LRKWRKTPIHRRSVKNDEGKKAKRKNSRLKAGKSRKRKTKKSHSMCPRRKQKKEGGERRERKDVAQNNETALLPYAPDARKGAHRTWQDKWGKDNPFRTSRGKRGKRGREKRK